MKDLWGSLLKPVLKSGGWVVGVESVDKIVLISPRNIAKNGKNKANKARTNIQIYFLTG